MKTTVKISIIILTIFLYSACEKGKAPVLSTNEVTNITGTTAVSGGIITDEGTGTVTSRGICWSTGTSPSLSDNKTSDGAGAGTFTTNLSGLNGATTYFLRAYATNNAGTGYGMVMSFTTFGLPPAPANSLVTNITTTSATVNGTVNPNYLSTVVTIEYGTNTSYGSVVTDAQGPLTGSSVTNVSADVAGLAPGTTYHYRIKAVNSLGITYSNDMTFATVSNSVTDIDGNYYSVVQIGTQFWTGENLKTTKFNDGSNIPLVTDAGSWVALATPGYCWYNNDEPANKNTYGGIYNFYAVSYGELCPSGWHVPTDNDFTVLADFLGGTSIAGGKMKETGTVHWSSPNTGATNETTFTALPGGQRDETGAFIGMGLNGIWWSSTPYNSIKPWYRSLGSATSVLFVGNGSLNIRGFSIRCIKD
jgi:uncharacterized protein (TIGR02145 family)